MSEFESQKEIKKNIDNLLKQLRSRSAQDRKKADAMFKKLMSSADEGSISSFNFLSAFAIPSGVIFFGVLIPLPFSSCFPTL